MINRLNQQNMTERQKFTNETPKAPQDILREKIANLKYPSSTENVALSELAGGTQELPNSIRLLVGRSYLYLYRDDITDAEYTHAKVQIGRFALDEEGNITDFVPDADDSLVRQTMSSLNHVPFFNALKNRFGIKDPDEENLARARQIAQESNQKADERQREIDALKYLAEKNRLNEPREGIDIENDEFVGSVGQAEIGVLNPDGKKRYLETLGAGPCIIVTAYDRSNKTAAMTHLDGLTDERTTLNQLFGSAGTVEIRVFGGDLSSINQLVSIKKILEEAGAVVEEWDILNAKKSIILDRETGKIFDVKKGRERKGTSKQDAMAMELRSLQGKQPAKAKIY